MIEQTGIAQDSMQFLSFKSKIDFLHHFQYPIKEMLNHLPKHTIGYLRSNIQRYYLRRNDLMISLEILIALIDQIINKYLVVI